MKEKPKSGIVSLRQLTNFGLLLFMLVFVLIVGRSVLVPLTFGALFAFILKPLCAQFERFIKWRSLAIALALLTAILPITLTVAFFSKQCIGVISDMPSIKEKLAAGLSTVYKYAKQTVGYSKAETDAFFSEKLPSILSSSSFVSDGFNTSTAVVSGVFLTLIYIFLFLLYRSAFKAFLLMQASEEKRDGVQSFLGKIQTVIQKYLQGLGIVIGIMGLLNSLGLKAIGIEHAFFWGFLAAMLAVIPFIGTFLGGLLPFLYALATAAEPWQPAAVVILFLLVQILEGNFITPKIVGSSVSVNPLAAILALLIGAEIWGIAGMILSLPMMAIFNEFLKQSNAWRPVSLLISDEIGEKEHLFSQKWDKEHFRLRNFFKLPH